MQNVNVHEAKTHFSRLVDQAAAGEEIIIAKAGRLVPLMPPHHQPKRRLGALAGVAVIPPDFDAPLPDDVIAAFAGRRRAFAARYAYSRSSSLGVDRAEEAERPVSDGAGKSRP